MTNETKLKIWIRHSRMLTQFFLCSLEVARLFISLIVSSFLACLCFPLEHNVYEGKGSHKECTRKEGKEREGRWNLLVLLYHI